MYGFALFLLCAIAFACSNEKIREVPGSARKELSEGTEKVYVSKAEILPGVADDNEISVQISGNLPNPAYKIERFEVNVRDTEIEITPLAQVDKDKVVIQMLVPFADTVKIKLKRLGAFSLTINGRGDTFKREVTINK